MTAYYNEHDEYAAQWLRNLIAAGHIAPGIVDTRSIEDVLPSDLNGFTQVHFFAGIGVWSRALRQAGWADDRPVWTGSCPCQPFSAAGAGAGFDDERHLWPAMQHLIQYHRPAIVIGEQVASKDAEPWIDLVQADMEAVGYAFGCVPFPASCVGAPHIRDRLYWVADADRSTGDKGGADIRGWTDRGDAKTRPGSSGGGVLGGLGNPFGPGLEGHTGDDSAAGGQGPSGPTAAPGVSSGVADTSSERRQQDARGPSGYEATDGAARRDGGEPNSDNLASGDGQVHGDGHPSPVNGFWRDADWLLCRDGRWRPVEPGTSPLVASAPSSVGRLRADWRTPAGEEGQGHRAGRLKGYGNAINAEAARVFIKCLM